MLYPLNDDIGFVELVDKMEQDTALKVVNSARISYSGKKEEFDAKDRKLTSFLHEAGHTSPFRHTYYTFHLKCPLFVFRQWVKYQVGSCWRTFELDGRTCSGAIFEMVFDTDRGCSWNEVSGRYVQLKPQFYVPKSFRANPSHGNKQSSTDLGDDFDHKYWSWNFEDIAEHAYTQYQQAIDHGICREQARMLLPQSIFTEAYWTVSLQAVMHFLSQRLH